MYVYVHMLYVQYVQCDFAYNKGYFKEILIASEGNLDTSQPHITSYIHLTKLFIIHHIQ